MKPRIIHELKKHIPFTALATLIAILITLFIIFGIKKEISENFFHVLHPLHILASALVTAGIFYKYKKSFIQAVLIGVLGSVITGSISDIIFPYFGGLLFNLNMEFHLPLIEKTILIISTAILGSILGISLKITRFPHFIHVFLSVFASLFYLLAFSQVFKIIYFIGAFFIVFISVIIPCCISDIIFPFLFLRKK